MPTTEFSNTAMGDAAEQIMKIVQKAAKLRDGHPDHLKLAVEIGDLMVVPGIQDPWYVSNDHSRIQQHPLKEKARSITIARPQPTSMVKASASIASVPALAKVKLRLKPMPKMKAV
ncbi:hypothetical protein BDR07DRAFT_1499642 [Suillus spraguei]|nr:hypothetical protein BDR07DRAFT_1499642 [Suillus spraguei]